MFGWWIPITVILGSTSTSLTMATCCLLLLLFSPFKWHVIQFWIHRHCLLEMHIKQCPQLSQQWLKILTSGLQHCSHCNNIYDLSLLIVDIFNIHDPDFHYLHTQLSQQPLNRFVWNWTLMEYQCISRSCLLDEAIEWVFDISMSWWCIPGHSSALLHSIPICSPCKYMICWIVSILYHSKHDLEPSQHILRDMNRLFWLVLLLLTLHLLLHYGKANCSPSEAKMLHSCSELTQEKWYQKHAILLIIQICGLKPSTSLHLAKWWT